MECKVQFVFGVLVILFAQSEEISISSNGHSPMRRMMTLDMKDIEVGGFVPINPFRNANHYTPTEKAYLNGTRLAVNERYRRLIPYMTFYLANNFNSPQTEAYSPKTEYQRVVIPSNGKLASSHYSSIPRYQGNRLSHFNIASAYPNKIIQDYFPKPPSTRNYPPSQDLHFIHNSPSSLQTVMPPPRKLKSRNNFQYNRPIPVPVQVSGDYFKTMEPPQIQFYTNTDTTETKAQQHYKLVPYEQTPPVPVPGAPDEEDYFVPKANPYTAKPANIPAKSNYQQLNYYQSPIPDKQYFKSIEQKEQNEVFSFTPTAENQYNKNNQNKPVYQPAKNYVFENPSVTFNPVIESGFKPMVNTAGPTPQAKYSYPTSTYNPIGAERQYNDYTVSTQRPKIYPNSAPINTPISHTENPEEYADISPNLNYEPESDDTFEQNNLAKILKSLQKTNSLPKTLTPDNIDSSIKTLVQILNNLKTNPTYVESSTPLTILSSPVPFKTHKPPTEVTSPRYKSVTKSKSIILPNQKPLPVHEYPPQDLDKEHPSIQGLGSNRDYLADENELGGTPGKPGIDYPILSAIPATRFDCKTQRYKGFFGDPETNCQVWHYCDLNGGQASFLCPNGTIFSQVALTCDWWFNVKCDSTAQLYVLNERLYKYILPYSPKFPEDYSGPLVDKYLTIKYKELEEKMKKQKKGSKPKPEDEPNGQDNESADMETEKAEIIEISTSGMTGALKHYQHQPTP